MSERLVRIDELAVGYTPDLPDQKPILWEDGRGVLFMDKTLQPMPGQIPLMSAGVQINAVSGAGDLIFLGTGNSVLAYSLSTAEAKLVTPAEDKTVGDWSFQPFGTWMFAVHGGKLWVWKPRDDEEFILDEDGAPTETPNPAYWPHDLFQPVDGFNSIEVSARLLLKCKNFLIAVCKDSIYWSDDDDPESWEPLQGNMAGNLFIRDIQEEIIGGVALDNFFLLATTREIVRVDYISRPYIFGYKLMFKGAGVWNSRSIVAQNKSIFGFGPNGIWVSDGSGITFMDNNAVGDTLNIRLDLNKTGECFCGAWGILQHVFFFIPTQDPEEPVLCFGFNLANSTWTMLDWDRFCSWEQYWVSSSGTLYIDDLKNAMNGQIGDGDMPLVEAAEGSIGMTYEGWGDVSYGGKIWCQV
jgi:hypothetical protein